MTLQDFRAKWGTPEADAYCARAEFGDEWHRQDYERPRRDNHHDVHAYSSDERNLARLMKKAVERDAARFVYLLGVATGFFEDGLAVPNRTDFALVVPTATAFTESPWAIAWASCEVLK